MVRTPGFPAPKLSLLHSREQLPGPLGDQLGLLLADEVTRVLHHLDLQLVGVVVQALQHVRRDGPVVGTEQEVGRLGEALFPQAGARSPAGGAGRGLRPRP